MALHAGSPPVEEQAAGSSKTPMWRRPEASGLPLIFDGGDNRWLDGASTPQSEVVGRMPCTPADLGIVLHNTDTAPLLCALSFVRVRHGKAAPLDGARPSQANAVAVSEYSHHLPCCKSTAWSHEKLE